MYYICITLYHSLEQRNHSLYRHFSASIDNAKLCLANNEEDGNIYWDILQVYKLNSIQSGAGMLGMKAMGENQHKKADTKTKRKRRKRKMSSRADAAHA